MNNNKYLILIGQNNSFSKYIKQKINENEECTLFDIYSKNILELITNIIKATKKIICSKWNSVIVFDEIKVAIVLSYIVKTKISLFYWNTIPGVHYKLVEKYKNKINIYTFDKNDYDEFNINLTQQFYFYQSNKCEQHNYEYDVLFVGEDKGRYNILKNISIEFKKRNIKYSFKVFNMKTYDEEFSLDEYLDYKKILNFYDTTRAILDITKENQVGYTLRVMEAIFFDKKLITNNKNIIKEPFYDKKKIFILGMDSYDDIQNFIKSKEINFSKEIKDYYSFRNWLRNII